MDSFKDNINNLDNTLKRDNLVFLYGDKRSGKSTLLDEYINVTNKKYIIKIDCLNKNDLLYLDTLYIKYIKLYEVIKILIYICKMDNRLVLYERKLNKIINEIIFLSIDKNYNIDNNYSVDIILDEFIYNIEGIIDINDILIIVDSFDKEYSNRIVFQNIIINYISKYFKVITSISNSNINIDKLLSFGSIVECNYISDVFYLKKIIGIRYNVFINEYVDDLTLKKVIFITGGNIIDILSGIEYILYSIVNIIDYNKELLSYYSNSRKLIK